MANDTPEPYPNFDIERYDKFGITYLDEEEKDPFERIEYFEGYKVGLNDGLCWGICITVVFSAVLYFITGIQMQ